MTERSALDQSLSELAASSPQGPLEDTESQLVAKFRRLRTRQRWRKAQALGMAAVAASAAMWFAFDGRKAPKTIVHAPSAEISAPFIALPYSQSDVPLEEAVIVRMEWRSAPSGGTVQADVLVGQDGVARAVRFVP